MKNRILIKLIFLIFTLFGFFNLHGQSISGTVHNLSVNGPGTVKATTESEICIFCHTPHNSSPVTPLWNRNDPGQTYILYSSSTIQATLGQPDGSSILCLSCHDGTIALGNVVSRSTDIDFSSGVTTMPVGTSNLSTDLSDDHPISFIYNSTLATNDVQLKNPTDINWLVELENDKVQCTSCHDPHKNNYTSFLKASSQYSDLCLSCHDRTYWLSSSHNTSTATYNGSNPWFHTPYTTVSENACENCHNPHNANGSKRLMKYDKEENNCFDCHNGNVAAANKNIQTEINKTYSHKVDSYDQIHDPNEDVEMQDIHVECEDCHNPHAARTISPTPSAPFVQGSNVGVRGIDQSGNEVNPAIYEYEICYRCHAEPVTFPVTGNTDRVIDNDNVRLDFDTGNPSHHAVVGVGANTDVPSLISPLTETSIIYCTDCHASDDAGGANGPHGSI